MKRLDDKTEEHFVKACVYGPPGTGKTNFGVSAPKPMIALTERQGMTHIRQAVKRLNIEMPQVFLIEEAKDLRNLVRALHGDRSKPFQIREAHLVNAEGEPEKKEWIKIYEGEWPETIVLDSATDACRLLVDEIRLQSPQTRGRDGLPVDSTRFWNVLIQRVQAMILSIRDLPMHAVFLALADDREKGDDDQKVRQLTPKMATRDLSVTLAAAVNVVGFTYRRTVTKNKAESEVQYGIMTTGPEYMTTKPYRPLRDREVPNFSYWVRVIRGETALQPAPLPSQEMGGGELAAADQPLKAEPANEGEGEASPAPATEAAASPAAEPAAAAPQRAPRKRRAG